jgi:hypothetical protein
MSSKEIKEMCMEKPALFSREVARIFAEEVENNMKILSLNSRPSIRNSCLREGYRTLNASMSLSEICIGDCGLLFKEQLLTAGYTELSLRFVYT